MRSMRHHLARACFFTAAALIASAFNARTSVVVLFAAFAAIHLLCAAADWWCCVALRRLAAPHHRRHPTTNRRMHIEVTSRRHRDRPHDRPAMIRPARELEAADSVWLFGEWRTVADVLPEHRLVRIVFNTGESTRLRNFAKIRCAA